MESEWYDVNYVGFNRVFVTGHNSESREVETELNDGQKLALYDFNEEQRKRERAFLKALINEK